MQVAEIEKYEEIKERLTQLVATNKKSWVEIYRLLTQVRDEHLYIEDCNSFTQWLKLFAKENHVHESMLWNRLKAGRIYNQYKEMKGSVGVEVPELEDVKASPDSLVTIEKINKLDPEMGALMLEKVMDNSLTRGEIRDAYEKIRLAKDINKVNHNPHDKWDIAKVNELLGSNSKEEQDQKEKITAAEIVLYLSKKDWLQVEEKEAKPFEYNEAFKYMMMPEFSVYTGTARRSRRIDALVVENATADDKFHLNLHGIEIKISKSDLKGNLKYMEYYEFVDYLWLCIPEKLLDTALETVSEPLGLLVVSKNEEGELLSRIERKPVRNNSIQSREMTLTSLLLRNI